MWATPVGEVHAIQALAKPGIALGVICIPGHVHIALDIKRHRGEWLQHTQELESIQQRRQGPSGATRQPVVSVVDNSSSVWLWLLDLFAFYALQAQHHFIEQTTSSHGIKACFLLD